MRHRYIVTGGGGFVGKALAIALRQAGHEVLSLSRGRYPELAELGISSAQVDLGSHETSWWELFKGADGVFHTAAKVDMWGRYDDFFRTNVTGTRNIIEACRKAGVRNLVFTSSPSVVHDGNQLCGIDESYPYPKHFDAFYPRTKAQAEQEVLASDEPGVLRTTALRPHLIWGPGDTNLVPTILERARRGRLTRIGDGENLIDLTYIDDCVTAHLLAMDALERTPERVGGKAYFISQGEPVKMWSWIDQVLIANGLNPVSKAIGARTAMTLAYVVEGACRFLLMFGIECKPLLTRFLVSEMYTSHYFNISRARNDLGYVPSYSVTRALEKTFQKVAPE
jgi:nucleoside-diphosphate-sugar epimerase